MTTPASIIGDTRMDSSLEIVYMLRRYELMRDSRRIVAPSPREETSMRQDEFFSMMKAFKYSPEDRLWGTLRDINMICRAKYFNPMRRLKSTSTKAPSSPQDEDAKRTLINMLDMLSWYEFDSTMKASTSTSAPTIAASTSLEKDNKWRLQTDLKIVLACVLISLDVFTLMVSPFFYASRMKW
ncbi:hypothetical protein Tco_0221962 [Tanacetum coccineum]